MQEININVTETGCQRSPLLIGYQGENEVTRVIVDYSAWTKEFGAGSLTLEVMRSGDEIPYLAPLTIADGKAVWLVSNVDTGAEGVGAAGFVYTVGDQIKKSAVFRFFVGRDIGGDPGERPDPYEGVIAHIEKLVKEAEDNAAAAETAQNAAETAQTAAEAARDAAAASATDAAGSATTATQQAQAAATARAAAETAQNAAETAQGAAETAQQAVEDLGVTAHEDPDGPSVEKSVDPETGAVTLDFGFKPAGVTEVNGQTGAVELDAEDVGALPDSSTLDDIPDGAIYKRPTAAQLQQIQTNATDIQTQGGKIDRLQADVDAIEQKIPNQASSDNQLADKAFVNSSINSAAAFFRGAFPTRAALFAVAWQSTDPQAENYVSNNDYAYVADDETHNDEAWRYIYVLQPGGAGNGWRPQFKVNESPLTAAQLAALNSGATAENIASIADKYVLPAGGMPSADMSDAVRASLQKADTALQAVPDTYRTAAAQDEIDQAQGTEICDLKSAINTKAPAIYNTASGAIATFDDGANGMPIKQVVVDIEPVQAGSGDPSPTNVRPISGWTGCNVYRSGADMSNPTTYPITFPASADTVYGGTLTINANGSGKISIDRAELTLTPSMITGYGAYQQTYYLQFSRLSVKFKNSRIELCDRYPIVSAPVNTGIRCTGVNALYIYDQTFTSRADAETWLSNNPVHVIYPLIEAVEVAIPSDMPKILTQLGVNNIWADIGEIKSAVYCVETALAIDNIRNTSPETYGAIGDGITDDTLAWQNAVNSGLNVIAQSKQYKCGKIVVKNNITIDCNGATFNCTGTALFDCTGTVTKTLSNEANYTANQRNYAITSQADRTYTGFAMLQGTNNFIKARPYYYGGFVCFFHNGIMCGSYPVDVENTTILLISPITATIKNVGDVVYIGESASNKFWVRFTYGINCSAINFNTRVSDFYMFLSFSKCMNCYCKNLSVVGATGTAGVDAYLICFSDSSFCSVEDSYLYNKNWHCITTGANYLCYRNRVINCSILNDTGFGFNDHENGIGTILRDCIIAGCGLGAQGVVDNVRIISSNNTGKDCLLRVTPCTDENLAGAYVNNVIFDPSPNSAFCGINVNCSAHVSDVTFYADNIKINKARVCGEGTGVLKFDVSVAPQMPKTVIVRNITINDCDFTIHQPTSQEVETGDMVITKAVYERVYPTV